MIKREALANKILLLGVDGLDPRLTKKYVEMGVMPNVAEYIKRGSAREDLVMLGGHPTVTPPMWTTLACGCYANVHGITGYYRCGRDIDMVDYNFDSRDCHAEPLWNAFAEAGKKTLVWHWPGSAWPPTSDSENLLVVDGTSPGSVGMATSQVEGEFLVGASELIENLVYIPKAPMEASVACIVTDLNLEEQEKKATMLSVLGKIQDDDKQRKYILGWNQHTSITSESPTDVCQSPIKPAEGWVNAPADAKEFSILFSGGAGVVSTVSEMALLMKVLAAKGRTDDGTYIISPRTIDLMRAPHLTEEEGKGIDWPHLWGYSYGLGVRTMKDPAKGGSSSSVGEFGWTGAAGGFALIDPDNDLALFYAHHMLNNQENFVAPRLRNILYSCL